MFQIQDRIVLKGTKKIAGVVLGIPESGNENRVLVCWDVNDVSYRHRSFSDLYKAHELDNMEITMAFIKGKPDNFSVINQDLIEDDLSKIEVTVGPETTGKMKIDLNFHTEKCPICGAMPIIEVDFDGEPGKVSATYKCPKCGKIESRPSVEHKMWFIGAQAKANADWNEKVMEIKNFIDHKNDNPGEPIIR